MKNNFLITRSNYDITTNYLYYWASLTIAEAQRRNFTAIDLKGKRANRKELESVVQKTKPVLIFLNGHGDSNTITGHDNQVLVQLGENESLFDGKIVYALSCCSAKKLGQHCVISGTKTFLGYDDDFIFMLEEKNITRPLQDKTAELFLAPSNQVIVSLLKGNTVREAYQRSQQAFRKNMRKYLTSETPQKEKEILPYLLWDMKHQVCLGDQRTAL